MNLPRLRTASLALIAMSGGVFLAGQATASETKAYTYDPLGRLVVAKSTGSVNNNQTHSICYDAAGNRITYVSNQTGTPPACVSNPGS